MKNRRVFDEAKLTALFIINRKKTFRMFPKSGPGLGIYKRKKESEQESKHARVHAKKNSIKKTRTRTRKHALVQESVHEKKNPLKKKR